MRRTYRRWVELNFLSLLILKQTGFKKENYFPAQFISLNFNFTKKMQTPKIVPLHINCSDLSVNYRKSQL